MADRWQQGMTATDRKQCRELLTEWFADHGYDEDHELRKLGSSACAVGSCGSCEAELPGGTGCPHECHDARADEIAELTAAWRERLSADA